MRVLVINCGSSTLKFQLIDIAAGNTGSALENRLAHGVIEHIGDQASIDCVADRAAYQDTMTIANHDEATRHIFAWLTRAGFLAPGSLDAVGHRVVHGGYRFTEPTCLDDNVIAAIDALRDLAPLHNEPALSAIRAAKAVLGTSVPMVAVFDPAQHAPGPPGGV
jgi:acetate kinase